MILAMTDRPVQLLDIFGSQCRGEFLTEAILSSKTKILIAAKKLFAEKGFEGASVDELAETAQVAKGTIYVHFKNKDEILLVLLEEALNQIHHIVAESTTSPRPFIECFRVLIKELLELFEKNLELFCILTTEKEKLMQSSSNFKKELHSVFIGHNAETQTQLTRFLQRGIAEGVLRKAEPEEAAMLLMAILFTFMSQWFMRGFTKPIGAKIDLITEYFFYGILKREEAI
jgi:TetR/AcrR family fatty acid metabolism transcriptional regulator